MIVKIAKSYELIKCPRMTPKVEYLVLGVLLSISLLLVSYSTTFLLFSLRSSQGLDESLCKCERLHGHQGRSIQPRIVNGTAFTNRHGLSWVVSIYGKKFNEDDWKKLLKPEGHTVIGNH